MLHLASKSIKKEDRIKIKKHALSETNKFLKNIGLDEKGSDWFESKLEQSRLWEHISQNTSLNNLMKIMDEKELSFLTLSNQDVLWYSGTCMVG